MILGVLSGIAGIVLLGSIVVEASYLAFAADDFAVKMLLSLAGLGMVHLGWRIVSSSQSGAERKK